MSNNWATVSFKASSTAPLAQRCQTVQKQRATQSQRFRIRSRSKDPAICAGPKLIWIAKTIMQGIVNGGRRRGRQKKRWEDNIREWTGLELRNTLRKAKDREEWKDVVGRSSAALRRIPNPRDR
ncbi:UDP-glucuronosyltransferase 2a1-like [Plakobranchus ocellatus]|uniref:UDP-glucuronosyltransferase 2a1-like n=1 Tax=Plakobranchus ocellatus TaxID=259542 RepID=A0AAV3Y8Q3_9GAST|nr:UDP-glucuronosyltransferase 2a1-like [Plakobranchus ocellatus]